MYNELVHMPNNIYRAVIYIRLSEADEGKSYESESESITNQRNLLMNFVKGKGFIFVGEYVDDGYSGTNFERPGFTKMIEDIKNKMANLVIVKDLSRLGRDHVMTGYYIENFFPENNIRFISLQENYDSAINQASNDSSTFIIACNDYYSRQNSIKIRSVLNDKRKKGKFIGSNPSYGYMKDPEEKGHLIPDPKFAIVVKKIFKLAASGMGLSNIASYLTDNKIKTPSSLKRKNPNSKMRYNEEWTISSVKKILKNRMYTGDMVQSMQTKVNYKSKKKITLDEKLWTIVENTHEALVDKETFEYVNNLRKRNTRNYEIKTNREKRLLEGKLFCKECKNRLTVLYRKKQNYWSVNCNRYSRDPVRGRCYSHFYPYNYLEEQVLEQINKSISKLIKEHDIKELNEAVASNIHKETTNIDKIVKELLIEKEKITSKLKTLYNDKCDGVISADTYKELAGESEQKLKRINKNIENQNIKKYKMENKVNIFPDYTKKIKKLLDLSEPKKELIDILVDRIVIDKDRNITIYFKYDVVSEVTFKYENRNLVRNPYGRKGKKLDC